MVMLQKLLTYFFSKVKSLLLPFLHQADWEETLV